MYQTETNKSYKTTTKTHLIPEVTPKTQSLF